MKQIGYIALTAVLFAPGLSGAAEEFPLSYSSVGIEGSYVDSGNSRDSSSLTGDNLSNYFEGSLNLTHQFNPNVSVLLQGGYAEPETRAGGLNANLLQGSLGGRLHPSEFRLSNWRPFGGLGYSYTDISVHHDAGAKTEDAVYLEGGLQRMIAPRFMIEGGIRGRTELEEGYIDAQYFTGIHYLFGRQYPAAPQIEVAVKTKHPAVVTPPKDSDRDGVIDQLDKCPGTPMGALVDSDGCAKKLTKEIRETLHVEFELDRTEVRYEFFPKIQNLAKVMKHYPGATILLEGHTDSTGSSSYNQSLSKSRADAVMKVLINEFGINSDRITTSGMGESQPVASNTTPRGRAENRRVEAIVSGKYSELLTK